MSETPPSPRSYYGEDVPRQWNRLLVEQQRQAEAAKRVLEGMRAVCATIRVDVRGDAGGSFFLNIEEGRMASSDAAARAPFVTLVQDRRAFERIVEEAGDSALGFLGVLSGLAGELKLTKSRVDNLSGVRGALRFEVSGPNGFALLAHFGPGPVPEEPTATIVLAEEGYRELRAGGLDPQTAFMSGKIQVEGDLQLAMQVALAALAPE